MKREIKFRAWDKGVSQMYDVSNMIFNSKSVCILRTQNKEVFTGLKNADSYIIMQYTGLKDRNGKEIYDGDVVACDSNGVNRYEHRVVCYDSLQTKYKSVPLSTYHQNAGNGGWTGYELKYHNEVIGNIYENPELLAATESSQ